MTSAIGVAYQFKFLIYLTSKMTKKDIVFILRNATGNHGLLLPEHMDIVSNNGILTVTMKPKGLTENMQTNGSAFEGWAIAIKANAPHLANKVIVEWHGLGLHVGKESNHYRRFLYRILRFEQSYEWASASPLDNMAKNDLEDIRKELPCWVANYPNKDSQDDAVKEEAKLERQLKNHLVKISEYCDHQLPVGLFYIEKNKANERTPRQASQIDLWSINGDKISVYELKKDGNKMVGIISELMFYANVIKDFSLKILKHANGAKEARYRSFNYLFDKLYSTNNVEVEAVFLTNDFHPIIKKGGSDLFNLLNGNSRDIKYKQMGFNKSVIFEIEQ